MSIVLNVAEGMGEHEGSAREQARYYSIARGSSTELLACLDLCAAWHLLDEPALTSARDKLDRTRAMLYRLVSRGG